jgi:hypothetical protein
MDDGREKLIVGAGSPLTLEPQEVVIRRLRERGEVQASVHGGWRTVVCDVDEVVAPLVPKMIGLGMEAGMIEPASEGLFDESMGRRIYEISKWLGYDEEKARRFWDLYGEDFYDDLPVTELGRALQRARAGASPSDLLFVSHTTDRTRASKDEWIRRHFPGARVEHVAPGGSKSEAINRLAPEYSTFIDDRADIVADVVLNTRSYGKEFLMPAFGYNEDIGPVLRRAVEMELVEVGRIEHRY